MKILMIFPIMFLVLTTKPIKPKKTPYDSLLISPLYVGKTTQIVIETSVPVAYFKFYITNDVVTDKEFLTVQTEGTGKHVYTYDNAYTRSTNQVYVRYSATGNGYSTSPVNQMNIVRPTYSNLDNRESITSQSAISCLTHNGQWNMINVTYNFQNFDELYTPDYYHKIDLSDFKVTFNTKYKDLITCTPTLVITNVEGVFDDIGSGNSVEFPLSIKQTTTGFSLQLKDVLYVNKETLLLSKTRKSGYVQTKHIYLPRNGMKNQSKFTAYLILNEFGIDRMALRHNFTFNALKNIVGDCQNSEYCIQRTY